MEIIIKEVFKEFGHYNNPFDLARYLHKILQEWDRVEYGRIPLPISNILKASQKSTEEVESIERDIEESHFAKIFFG